MVHVGKERCVWKKLYTGSKKLLPFPSFSLPPSLLPPSLSSFFLTIGWDKVMRGISDALDIGLSTVKVSLVM